MDITNNKLDENRKTSDSPVVEALQDYFEKQGYTVKEKSRGCYHTCGTFVVIKDNPDAGI